MSAPGSDDLAKEIEDALSGVNLQHVDLSPSRRAASSGAGPGTKPGARDAKLVTGTVVGVHGDDVIVELGPRSQGVATLAEFQERPKEGQVFEFAVRGEQDGLLLLSRGDALALSSWREIEPGKVVSARVTAVNTGGLELKVGPLPAFLPASHVDLKRVDDLSQYLNQTLVCEVLEVDPEKRRVLLSRRSVLERERERARDEQVAGLAPGQVVRGKVVRLESFGAFVEIAPGLEGLLHVSNVSRKRVEKVEDELEVGQTLELLVLSVEQGGKRIGLGRKQLEANPWDELSARLPLGTVVEGRVTRVAEFGAFVEVLPGIEGLVHVSQLARDRLRRARDAAKVGETFPVRVLAVEPERERLSLTRLDPHGALLGTEEAADTDRIVEEIERSRNTAIGTNLGDLLKRAKRD